MSQQIPLQNVLNYRFSNELLLHEALEVAGACNQPGAVTGDNEGNKRLALLGDALIRLLILDGWYKIVLGVGDEAVSYSASNKALSQLAHKYGLEDYVTKNPCQHGDVSDYTLATTLEALLGAVWIDCNKDFKVLERVSSNLNMVKK